MEALLASPASYSSPESNASSGFDSPRLPDLESPVRFGQHDIFTPSSAASTTTQEIPAWLSEDLEEEWVEREASDSFDMTRSPVIESIRTYASSSSASSQRYNSVKPRQPSTLRHVMSNSSLQNTDPSENGSVVVKSVEPVNLKSPAQPSQLEVAARAMRGDRGGLGSPAVRSVSQKLNLLKLFDPPSPSSGVSICSSQAVILQAHITAASPLPASQIAAPSKATFDFTPIRTDPPRTDEITPKAAALPDSSSGATPTRALVEATAPKPRGRYLKSAAVAAVHRQTDQERSNWTDRSLQGPGTPATFHTASDGGTPQSVHRIFEYQHDTYTREHLDALVDDIDALSPSNSGSATVLARSGALSAYLDEGSSDEVSEDFRSSKRIRLASRESNSRSKSSSRSTRSPRRDQQPATSTLRPGVADTPLPDFSRLTVFSPEGAQSRSRGGDQALSSPVSDVKSRLGEANALLERLRNRSSRPTTPQPLDTSNSRNLPTLPRPSVIDSEDVSDLIKLDDSLAHSTSSRRWNHQGAQPMFFDRDQGRWVRSSPMSSPARVSLPAVIAEENEESTEDELDVTTRGDLPPSLNNSTAQASRVVSLSQLEAGGLGITEGTPQATRATAYPLSPLDVNHFSPAPDDRSPVEPCASPASPIPSAPASSTPAPAAASLELSAVAHSLPADDVQTPRPVSRSNSAYVAPRSAMKSARSSNSESTPDENTPMSRPPRSVSFSDGKRTGQIEGLVSLDLSKPASFGSRLRQVTSGSTTDDGDLSEGETGPVDTTEEISAASNATTIAAAEQSRAEESVSDDGASSSDSAVICSFESAPRFRKRTLSRTPTNANRTFTRTTAPDATFMTQCSFSVSHEKLVQYITDVEPFEPNWEGLKSIALAGKGADSLVRLKDFLPSLDWLDISRNDVAYLTGLPTCLRTLVMPSNKLTDLTSFAHLPNLESIDVCNNQLATLKQLSCLKHLRVLKADHNNVASVEGIAEIDGLIKLSIRGNTLGSIDVAATKWQRLEYLDVSKNAIEVMHNVEQLTSLTLLNLDHNKLADLTVPTASMPRLRVLRVSHNDLTTLDVAFAPKLRTLFADNTHLSRLHGTKALRKLENLSLRDQDASDLALPMAHIRDVRRLYLSGNPLASAFPSDQFYNLTYLELAMCRIEVLPEGMSALIPNIRTLDISHNPLSSLDPLRGLVRLQKLIAIGTRVNKCRPLLPVLESIPELEELDLRATPLTLTFYAPTTETTDEQAPHSAFQLVSSDDLGSTSSKADQWVAIDTKFRKSLSDEWYQRRTTYRAFVVSAAKALVELDGVPTKGERGRYERLVVDWKERKALTAELTESIAAV